MRLLARPPCASGRPPPSQGLLRLAWRLRRPAARRGLARALGLLEALGSPQPHRPGAPPHPLTDNR